MRFFAFFLSVVLFGLPSAGQTGAVGGQVPSALAPVQGAHIYLYAFGTTGYGSSPTSLLIPTSSNGVLLDSNNNGYVVSDSSGAFDLTGKYTCPTATSMIYAVATGGNPGLAAGTENAAIHFVEVLGDCGAITNAQGANVIDLDEFGTVSSVWAFQQFIDPTKEVFGTPSASQAEASYSALGDTYTASAQWRDGFENFSSPRQKINTIASVLNACSYSASPTPCTSLYAYTKPSGGVAPVDIFQAAYYMATIPAKNVSQLFALIPSNNPAFQVPLSSAPLDWLISISYSGGGLSAPGAIAIDGTGSIWIVNPSASSVSRFNQHGASLSGGMPLEVLIGPDGPIPPGIFGGGLSIPSAIAIDQAGNAWIANCGSGCPNPSGLGNVTELNSTGVLSPSSGFSLGGLTYSSGIAVDSRNNVWVSNDFSNSIAELSSSGQLVSLPSGLSTASLKGPLPITFDTAGNLWLGNSVTGTISKFDSTGTEVSGSPFSITGLTHPLAMAVDPGGNIWVLNGGSNTVSELTNAGAAAHTSNYSGGGLQNPQALAIDSWGTIWIANANSTLSVISGTNTVLSPSTGYQPDGLDSPAGIAIDQAGGLWITNSGTNSITRVIGVARSVATPLVTAIQANPKPASASALCKDGTYSSSANRSGTCSSHGGVAEWLTL